MNTNTPAPESPAKITLDLKLPRTTVRNPTVKTGVRSGHSQVSPL